MSALIGCAGMVDSMNKSAGIGVVSVQNATYDGTMIIKVTPNWLYKTQDEWNQIKLGARWVSTSPDHIALILEYNSSVSKSSATYLGIKRIDINIDGNKSTYKATQQTSLDSDAYNTVSKTIYTTSTNYIVIPLLTLKAMANSTNCRLRIHTTKGYEDSVFSIERTSEGYGTTLVSIREFLAAIDNESKKQRL